MPDLKSILPLEQDRYYHIFNRGNNYEKIFYTHENYLYFLRKYKQYLSNSIDTYAYCLMPNHFHLLIKTKDTSNSENEASENFRRFFISYSMSINKQENRSGSLFLKNFKRIIVESNEYLKNLIFYIHHNPVKHGYTEDLKDYKHSSYQSLLSTSETNLKRKEVMNEIFGNKNEFIEFHQYLQDTKKIEKYIIED